MKTLRSALRRQSHDPVSGLLAATVLSAERIPDLVPFFLPATRSLFLHLLPISFPTFPMPTCLHPLWDLIFSITFPPFFGLPAPPQLETPPSLYFLVVVRVGSPTLACVGVRGGSPVFVDVPREFACNFQRNPRLQAGYGFVALKVTPRLHLGCVCGCVHIVRRRFFFSATVSNEVCWRHWVCLR